MKTPIEILDEMIDELNPEGFIPSNTDSIVTSYLREAKERIQKETQSDNSLIQDIGEKGNLYHIFGGKRNRIKRLKFLEEKLDEGLSWADISKITGRDRTVEFNFHKKWIHLLNNE